MDQSVCNNDFIRRYSPLVIAAIHNRLRKSGLSLSSDEIDEIRQDLFASLCENNTLSSIKDEGAIPYWLAIVSGNSAMEYLRRRRRLTPPKPISLFEKVGETELIDLIPSSGPSALDEIGRNELSRRIDEAIEKLSTKEKLVIKLHLLHDKKYEEIVEITRLPYGTVSNYIMRAKAKLRKELEDFR